MHTPLPKITACPDLARFDPAMLASVELDEKDMALVGTGPYGRHGFFVYRAPRDDPKAPRAQFANGVFTYYALVGIVGGDGKLRPYGAHTIPVLPGGDLIMVVNQRPGILAGGGRRVNDIIFTDGRPVMDLGPLGSVEFSGGSAEPGESVSLAMLRETKEETGLKVPKDARALSIRRVDPVMLQLSEFIIAMYDQIVFLPPGCTFPDFVTNDGGLRVFRISPKDLALNFARGAIVAGSTRTSFEFFRDCMDAQILNALTVHGAAIKGEVLLV